LRARDLRQPVGPEIDAGADFWQALAFPQSTADFEHESGEHR